MAHLDENAKSSPAIRTSIAEVLSKIIAIAAGESVGMFFFAKTSTCEINRKNLQGHLCLKLLILY